MVTRATSPRTLHGLVARVTSKPSSIRLREQHLRARLFARVNVLAACSRLIERNTTHGRLRLGLDLRFVRLVRIEEAAHEPAVARDDLLELVVTLRIAGIRFAILLGLGDQVLMRRVEPIDKPLPRDVRELDDLFATIDATLEHARPFIDIA